MDWLQEFPSLGPEALTALQRAVDAGFVGFTRAWGPTLEAVFEPFRRLEDSRNRDTGGIGLGLSIARDIAELHGGSLLLRNRLEGGLEALLVLSRQH